MSLQLLIGNKNYSSWSMRPWVLMRQAGIAFEEIQVRFDSFEADSDFKRRVSAINPLGKVPALIHEGFVVWDSLAIAEYLAERFPERRLWPSDPRQRARARSVCAEMHSGFAALRNHCPMNIEAELPDTGAQLWRERPELRADVARLDALWGELLAAQNGDGLLFGDFGIADAFFAPVASRIRSYALPVAPASRAYAERLLALPGVKAWVDEALAEHDFIAFDEPYRQAPAAR